MKIMAFLIVLLSSYVIASEVIDHVNNENSTVSDDKKEEIPAIEWPKHWVLEGATEQRQKYVTWYSPNQPLDEFALSLKHFTDIGYDAIGAGGDSIDGATDKNRGLIHINLKHYKIFITLNYDEQGSNGCTIVAQIRPLKRKENL